MDCEKFEPLLLDELYEELDEVTSAAVKRHVSGCARCASILNGMRSTRSLVGSVGLPMLPLPDGLEDRILSSVKEAQKVVPIQSRAQRLLSLAGSWAMRPQTAMAAVFLLMIGTSAFVIRSRHAGSDGAAAVSVSEQGAPAGQVAPPAENDSLDNKAAAAAHGANVPAPITAPPVATTQATGAAASAASAALARAGDSRDPNNTDRDSFGVVDGVTAGKGRVAKEDEGSLGSAFAGNANGTTRGASPSTPSRDAPKDKAAMADEEAQASNRAAGGEKKQEARRAQAPITNAGPPAGAPGAPAAQAEYAPHAQSVAPPAPARAADQQDGFSAGMAAYRSRNYPEATRQFDSAARSGDQNAALWAAKAVKDGNGGCSAAVPRFDAVATKSSGSWVGSEAQLESARCQIALGQLDPARDKLTRLTRVASHAQVAQQALNELNQVAQRREAERSKSAGAGGGSGAARPAAPAPVRAPAKPAATAVDQAGF